MIKLHNKLICVSFYTLGCRLNQSETAVIERTFERDGYKLVEFKEPADIVVINTCTVTENGDADTRRLVNKVNRINPDAQIALIGCQAQVQKERLAKLPNVRWIVGNEKKMAISEIVKDYRSDFTTKIITPTISRKSFTQPTPGIDLRHTRANLKIQDGCDFFCSFCEIPYARGRARSRVFEDIVQEAKALSNAGHQELVITGINVGTYQFKDYNFMDVIDALEQIQGLKRIRISSIEPTTIPFALFDKMRGRSKLCRHIHIPLQSGHEEVLKAMKRKYTPDEFKGFIERVFHHVPEICIGTDVIVGFPGEEDQHFEETRRLLDQLPIHYFHVFSYSQRVLAKSQSLGKIVPVNVIQERSRQLRKLGLLKRQRYYQGFLHSCQDVLFEQSKNGYYNGLTDNYIRVQAKSTSNITNQFHPVKLNKLEGLNMYGIIGAENDVRI